MTGGMHLLPQCTKRVSRPKQKITAPYHSRASFGPTSYDSEQKSFIRPQKLLHPNQHGFRRKLSCETQLIQLVQDISETLNESGQADIIVMDLSKAFDKVDHRRLLLKLHRFGINNDVISWIKSFLTNRTQKVVLDGEESESRPVMSGVPQGSVLGPCLFLMYINDMPDMIESNIRLFADDTIIYLTVTNQTDCQALQADLIKLEIWESEWLMAFNPDKCEVIRITNKKKKLVQLHSSWDKS